MNSKYISKRHNRNLMLYHLVCPSRYRRKIFTDKVGEKLKEICLEMGCRYEIHFAEIGADEDHVHFLIQSVPMMCGTRIVTIVKSITARELFRQCPEIKKMLWGGNLWSSGYYISTVGQHGNETVIRKYVENQGKIYKQIHRSQLTLFDGLI